MGLMGMAQVVATIAYGIRCLRRGETTWDWPDFNANPEQENLAQMSRWSLNSTPAWEFPPLAIANQYHDQQTNQVKRARYRLIVVRGSDLAWLNRDRLQEVKAGPARRPDGSVGMALVLPALTDCRWWFESLLVHSGVSSATRRKPAEMDSCAESPVPGSRPVCLRPTYVSFRIVQGAYWADCGADRL